MYASKKHENIHNICYTLVAMFDLNLRVTENSQSLLVNKNLKCKKRITGNYMEQYYYNRMNKIEQAVYHALYQGFLNIDEEIQIPRLEGEVLYNVFFKLRLDHPEIFWATGYKYKYYNDSPNLIFVPEYLFEKAKIKEHQKAMTARVEKITREAKTFSQWDKEKYIHDFLCENVHYDKLKKPYSHEIIGPLGHGVGVCEGIAKSVKVLCDVLGIWCMIAV